MGRIHILSENVANKIAAGEVVERPASVVKELLENSLDAGAERIRLDVEGGGKKRIHIVDDGCGMVRDDAMLAFERHATSKLRSAQDLLTIATMGFRGEALPSIAAVSRLLMETRSSEEPSGTRIEIAGGKMLRVEEAGLPAGTSITVSDLFYNTPARRKFLRAESTELSHITSLVTHYALAYPEKSFSLRSVSGDLLNVTPVAHQRERVYQVFGAELLNDLTEFGPVAKEIFVDPVVPQPAQDGPAERERVELSVRGFLSRPQMQKMNRDSIYIFVNRRLIRDRVLMHAIQEAYRNILPPRCFPFALLFLEMPCAEVDVNVHPSKIEVRFRHQQVVHDLVRDALRDSLATSKPLATFPAATGSVPQYQVSNSATQEPRFSRFPRFSETLELTPPPVPPQALSLPLSAPNVGTERTEGTEQIPGANSPTEGVLPQQEGLPSEIALLKPLGQIRESFIVASSHAGLWLIDQHVAHERVLFEILLERWGSGGLGSQRLLMPIVLRLSPAQNALWSQIADELVASGFEAEPFGQNTLAVKSVPAGVKPDDVQKLLVEILENIEKESRTVTPEAVRYKIAASVACHAAIKVNTPLDQQKMEWLLAELATTRHPMSCPHGRPVVLKYEMKDILKAFHRI